MADRLRARDVRGALPAARNHSKSEGIEALLMHLIPRRGIRNGTHRQLGTPVPNLNNPEVKRLRQQLMRFLTLGNRLGRR